LKSDDDLLVWIQRLEADFQGASIPRLQWSDATILFLDGPVNIEMRKRRKARKDVGWMVWVWEEFVMSLREVLAEHNAPSSLDTFRMEHPGIDTAAKVAGTGLVVAGGAVLTPLVVVGGLNALGFTAAGVASGSIAAGLQSALYGGATTGVFSVCQSIAATGAVPAVVSFLGSVGAGAAFLGSTGNSDAPNNGTSGSENPGSMDGRDAPPPPYTSS